LNSAPTYNSTTPPTLTINTTNPFTPVSGIYILNTSTPVLSISKLSLNNMGDYFYYSPLLTYTFTGGVTGTYDETSLSHTNFTITSTILPAPLTFDNTSINTGLTLSSTTYYQNITLSTIKFSNIYSQNILQTLSISANVVVDPLTINMYNSKIFYSLSQATLSSLNAFSYGYRVISAPPNNTQNVSNVVPYPPYYSTSSAYTDIAYSNTAVIGTSDYAYETLIANGSFTTNPNTINNYYKDYSTFAHSSGGSNPNYSTLNTVLYGYRYSTFAWTIPTGINVTNIKIKMTMSSPITLNTNNYASFTGGYPLGLYVRLEVPGKLDSTYSNTPQNPNTAWISMNSNTGNQYSISISNLTTYSVSSGIVLYATPNPTYSSSIYTNYIQIPTANYSSAITLYCRVGIPQTSSIGFDGFSSISASVS
jgi:hypothetical protein